MKVVLITAIWCPSCIIMRPRYYQYFKNLNIEINELDFDDDEKEIEKYKIGRTLPVCIVLNGEEEVIKIIGEKSEKELNKLLSNLK